MGCSRGDLPAITNVVKQAFTTQEVHVEAEMQFGVTLWLKLKSDEILDSQDCLNIISKSLDAIKPQKITLVRVSETSPKSHEQQVWNKYLAVKQGRFVDNTKETNQNQNAIALCGVAVFGLLLIVFGLSSVMFVQKSTSTNSSPSNSSTSAQVVNFDQEAQPIFDEIRQKYDFSRFIDTWGMGTQGLFLPEPAWSELSSSQRDTLINYARSKNIKAIIIGKLLAPNTIALDRTVWGD